MPGISELLASFLAKPPAPPSIPQDQLAQHDAQVRAQQKGTPAEYAGNALEMLAGYAKGLVPFPTPPDPTASRPHNYTDLGTLLAGVAFPPGMKAFHGTARTFEKFAPSASDGLIHAAEDAGYAAAHARNKVVGSGGNALIGGNVIPMSLDVKNAIDLTPSGLGSNFGADAANAAGDIRKLEAVLPSEVVPQFKEAKRSWRFGDADARKTGQQNITALLVDQLVKQNPHLLQDAGFDGIRYLDGNAPAWAVPDPNQIINYLTKERGVGNLPGPR